jgi:hypothetical protein
MVSKYPNATGLQSTIKHFLVEKIHNVDDIILSAQIVRLFCHFLKAKLAYRADMTF